MGGRTKRRRVVGQGFGITLRNVINATRSSGACPRCGCNYSDLGIRGEQLRGGEVVVSQTLPCAISWSTHVLFDLMKREWQRPIDEKTVSWWGQDGQNR